MNKLLFKRNRSPMAWMILFLFFPFFAKANTSGSLYPGTVANDPFGGASLWNGLANIEANDGVYASSTIPKNNESEFLKATNLGFSIPGNATISGILVEDSAYEPDGTGFIEQDTFGGGGGTYLVKAGSAVTGTLKTNTTPLTTSPVTYSWGSGSDLWSQAWTPSDINNSGFGVDLGYGNDDNPFGGNPHTAYVDFIRVTVTYTLPSPPGVTTSIPTLVSTSSIVMNGSITSGGSASSTVRGFAWGITSDLSGGDTSTTTESGTFGVSSFSTSTSGLTPSTIYYFRAYATNPAGTGFGLIVSTTTIANSVTPTASVTSTPAPAVYASISGGTVSPSVLATLLIPSPQTTAYLNSITVYHQSVSDTSSIILPATSTFIFERNLTAGSTGDDVKKLQEYLNSHGFTISTSGAGSPGFETIFFGSLTKAALIRLQKIEGISPAIGYFGPVTMQYINSHQ